MVAVVDLFGKPLMPTNEYRARKLLKQKEGEDFRLSSVYDSVDGTEKRRDSAD